MDPNDEPYRKLQRHLNKQAIGFPATRSGVELKLLKHIFNPLEAQITCALRYQFETVETIYSRAAPLVSSTEELERKLDCLVKKGGIEGKVKEGRKHYCCAPLVVGMYEFQLERLTPQFITDFNKYTSTVEFGLEFLSTKIPQMRTIPVSKSIQPDLQVSRFDEMLSLLNEADGPFVVLPCICRKKRSFEGRACRVTQRKETCLAMDHMADMSLAANMGRKISRDEAISILEANQEEGLVLQPSNTRRAEFVCSCCGCCCGMLKLHQNLPNPLSFWATNFYAVVDPESCSACGVCEGICQVRAIKRSEKNRPAVVNVDRCLGCGNCLNACPCGSIRLCKKEKETVPPQSREELYDIIMANRKGKMGKLLLAGTLILEAVRSGQTRWLRF